MLKKLIKKSLVIGSTLILFPFIVLLRMFHIRFLGIKHIYSIGHLSLEPDFYLKEMQSARKKKHRMILLLPTSRIVGFFPRHVACNRCLVNLWKEKFIVFESPWIYLLLQPFSVSPLLRYRVDQYAMEYWKTSKMYSIQNEYTGEPNLKLDPSHIEKGMQVLSEMGIPKDSWFVCFHAREPEYYSEENLKHFSYRNSEVDKQFSAIKAIVDRGGWVIRVGSSKSQPLGQRWKALSHCWDYTQSDAVSDWMDVFLISSCRFFLTTSTGLSCLAIAFDVPTVFANVIPFCNLSPMKNSIVIPKLYVSKKTKRHLLFSQIVKKTMANYIHNHEFDRDHIELVDNTEEEIKDLTLEMLGRMEGKKYSQEEEELQQKFHSLLGPDNFCYGASGRIGSAFLKKYKHLLEV